MVARLMRRRVGACDRMCDMYAPFRDIDDHRLSAWALIAANALALFGVLFLGWSTFAVVALYWCENVIIGAINILKMMFNSPQSDQIDLQGFPLIGKRQEAQAALEQMRAQLGGDEPLLASHAAKLFFIPFFTFHYGLFCLVHGVFVFVLTGHGMGGVGSPLDIFGQMFGQLREEGLLWVVGALAASHFVSFFKNYIAGGEYRRTLLPMLMFQPYGRIVVLHLALLFGAFLTMSLGSPVWLLLLLIIGKTVFDLGLHLRERRRNRARDGGSGSDGDVLTTAAHE